MSGYKGLFTYDIDNHKYIPIEQADKLIDCMNYHPEPKEYWYISDTSVTLLATTDNTDEYVRKNIGNHFETEEEAEKAVRKLKAWKRLKNKGFSFGGWNWKTQCVDYNLDYTDITEEQIEEAEKDLDLLFSEEDD